MKKLVAKSYLAQLVRLHSFIRIFLYDKWQYIDSKLKNCPPNDAQPASGTVYYLVKHDPPIAIDFEPKAIRDQKSVKVFLQDMIQILGIVKHTEFRCLQIKERH